MESGDVVKGVQQAVWQFLDSYRPFQRIAEGVAIGMEKYLSTGNGWQMTMLRTLESGVAKGVEAYLRSINWRPESAK